MHRGPTLITPATRSAAAAIAVGASGRFPVRFYLIAMLFVIFDVEAASYYPWAVQMHALRVFGLLEMIVFVIVLAIGYAYVWKKGGVANGTPGKIGRAHDRTPVTYRYRV